MPACIVVELEICIQAGSDLRNASIVFQIDVHVFDGPPQSFNENVIERPSLNRSSCGTQSEQYSLSMVIKQLSLWKNSSRLVHFG